MTRNRRGNQLPIERWTRDCLDVRFLKREGFLDSSWVAIGPSLRWPRIARMRIARYLLILDLQGHSVPHIFAPHGLGFTSEVTGLGCIARTARGVWRNSTGAWPATSAAHASAIRHTRPSC